VRTIRIAPATALLPSNIALAFSRDQVPVFINELHYDTTGLDQNEAVEIAVRLRPISPAERGGSVQRPGEDRSLRAVRRSDLNEQPDHLRLYRGLRNAELAGDHLVRLPFHEKGKQFALALSKRVRIDSTHAGPMRCVRAGGALVDVHRQV
jgi:hypothetical protein